MLTDDDINRIKDALAFHTEPEHMRDRYNRLVEFYEALNEKVKELPPEERTTDNMRASMIGCFPPPSEEQKKAARKLAEASDAAFRRQVDVAQSAAASLSLGGSLKPAPGTYGPNAQTQPCDPSGCAGGVQLTNERARAYHHLAKALGFHHGPHMQATYSLHQALDQLRIKLGDNRVIGGRPF